MVTSKHDKSCDIKSLKYSKMIEMMKILPLIFHLQNQFLGAKIC